MHRMLASWWIVVPSLAATLFFAFVLFPASAKRFRPEGGKHIVHLQLAFTVSRFRSILLEWSTAIPDAMTWLKHSVVRLDFVFPVLYAMAFASIYALIASRAPSSVWDPFFVVVPFVAALVDWIENALHLSLIRGVHTSADVQSTEFKPALVFGASIAATTKLTLLAVSVAGWVFAGVR